MSDMPDPDPDEPAADAADEQPDDQSDDTAVESASRPTPSVTDDGRSVREYLEYGAIAVLTLFALVAAFRFYVEMGQVISVWVAEEYQSLFQAGFNLVVLLLAGGGIAWQLRRLGD